MIIKLRDLLNEGEIKLSNMERALLQAIISDSEETARSMKRAGRVERSLTYDVPPTMYGGTFKLRVNIIRLERGEDGNARYIPDELMFELYIDTERKDLRNIITEGLTHEFLHFVQHIRSTQDYLYGMSKKGLHNKNYTTAGHQKLNRGRIESDPSQEHDLISGEYKPMLTGHIIRFKTLTDGVKDDNIKKVLFSYYIGNSSIDSPGVNTVYYKSGNVEYAKIIDRMEYDLDRSEIIYLKHHDKKRYHQMTKEMYKAIFG